MGRGESWDPNLAVGLLKCYLCYYPQMPPSADFQLNYERWGVLGQLKRKGAVWGGGRHSAGECEWEPAPPWPLLPLFHVHIVID